MAQRPDLDLSRRERQIMNVLFRRGQATVVEIAGELPDPPSETAVRTFLKILEGKGHVRRQRQGRRHVYRPAKSRKRAARAALSDVLGTFFGGSLGEAVAAHLSDPATRLGEGELERLRHLIREAEAPKRANSRRKKGDA